MSQADELAEVTRILKDVELSILARRKADIMAVEKEIGALEALTSHRFSSLSASTSSLDQAWSDWAAVRRTSLMRRKAVARAQCDEQERRVGKSIAENELLEQAVRTEAEAIQRHADKLTQNMLDTLYLFRRSIG